MCIHVHVHFMCMHVPHFLSSSVPVPCSRPVRGPGCNTRWVRTTYGALPLGSFTFTFTCTSVDRSVVVFRSVVCFDLLYDIALCYTMPHAMDLLHEDRSFWFLRASRGRSPWPWRILRFAPHRAIGIAVHGLLQL